MENKTFRKLLTKWTIEKLELNRKKSNDYADDGETLKNFKQMSNVLNALEFKPPWTPWKFAQVMILMKMQRELNLIQNCKTPSNEAIEDTEQDKSLYCDLGRACLLD